MKKIITYTVVALLSLLYLQNATAQDTIATFESPYNSISDMIATQDGNLLLVTNHYVKKVTTDGEELWSFESDNDTYCKKIVERQNGNFLITLGEDIANICELDNNTGELLNKCIITHPDYSIDSYIDEYEEMPDQSICAIWGVLSPNIKPYIVNINEDLSDYNFITQSDDYLINIASINETQFICTSILDVQSITESGTKVYDISGELITENLYSDELLPINLKRLDDSRFVSLNNNYSTNKANVLFCGEMGESLQNIEINIGAKKGDIAINEEDQIIYIAIQSNNKKDYLTPKSGNPSIWSINFDGEVVDSMFFSNGSNGVGITYLGDYIYFCFGLDIAYIVKIHKSELVSVKEPKILEANTYPNPAQDVVYFMWESQKLDHGIIDIIDLQGKVVSSVSIDNTSAAWNCANFANGVYLYRVTDDGKTVGGGKIVVSH